MNAFTMSPALWIVVDALAVFRLTKLVTTDTITEPIRRRVQRRGWTVTGLHRDRRALARKTYDLVTCPWCISVWIAAVVVVLTVVVPGGWRYVAYVLTCSAVAGFLAERS